MDLGGRVVVLAGEFPSTRIVYHALKREFSDVRVILEARPSRMQLIRRRLSRLGLLTVAGQIGFMIVVQPVLRRRSARRVEVIKRQYRLDDRPIDGPVINVPSVNSDETRAALRELAPAVVVVNGTRLIDDATLASIPVPVINTHLGITPTYRGVHGGYWALADGRPELAGTTVHLVDGGIDTGGIIAQATIPVTPEDTFVTYPYLQIAAGVPILVDAVRAAMRGTLEPRTTPPALPSKLRTHPTVWGYLTLRLTRGVR